MDGLIIYHVMHVYSQNWRIDPMTRLKNPCPARSSGYHQWSTFYAVKFNGHEGLHFEDQAFLPGDVPTNYCDLCGLVTQKRNLRSYESRRGKRGSRPISPEIRGGQRIQIITALVEMNGNVPAAARLLDWKVKTFRNRLELFEIDPDVYRPVGWRRQDRS